MKKARWLLLVLPLVAGALYLRSLSSWRPKVVMQLTGGRGEITRLVFSPDSKTLLVGRGRAEEPFDSPAILKCLESWDTTRFTPQWQIEWEFQPSKSSSVHTVKVVHEPQGHSLQFVRSGSHILIDGNLELLEAKTGNRLLHIRHAPFRYSTLSPDEQWLASTDPIDSQHPDQHRVFIHKFWLRQQGGHSQRRVQALPVPLAALARPLTFSPSGEMFALPIVDANGARLDLYDTTTWKRTATLKDWGPAAKTKTPARYLSIQWSYNGRYLLTWIETPKGDMGANLWHVSDGKRLSSLWSIRGAKNPWPMTPSPRSFEVQNDGRLLIWGPDPQDGSRSANVYLSPSPSFQGPSKRLFSLRDDLVQVATLSPDGSSLFVGTRMGRVYRQRLK